MVTNKTIYEIEHNYNTGVEYEIALFRCLLQKEDEIRCVDNAIRKRYDCQTVQSIIRWTSTQEISDELHARFLSLEDVSFETQNDDVGPSDIVMYTKGQNGANVNLGLSIKYANKCNFNVTGRKFLADSQIAYLRELQREFTQVYVSEMRNTYGHVDNWFHARRQSSTTDMFIDQIRDAVIANWINMTEYDKRDVLMRAYHETSPIEYWVYTYTNSSQFLNTDPYKIDPSDIPHVLLMKHETSFIGFYLRDRMIGKMQVKFNNGFVEKCRKACPDIVVDGVRMSFGHPFSSWNFCVV